MKKNILIPNNINFPISRDLFLLMSLNNYLKFYLNNLRNNLLSH